MLKILGYDTILFKYRHRMNNYINYSCWSYMGSVKIDMKNWFM